MDVIFRVYYREKEGGREIFLTNYASLSDAQAAAMALIYSGEATSAFVEAVSADGTTEVVFCFEKES